MTANEPSRLDGRAVSAAQSLLPNESRERWQEQEILPAGAAPASLGKKSSNSLVCEASPKHEPRRKGRIAFSWLGVLLVLSLATIAAERLRAAVSYEVESGSTRVGWYFRSGQWLADVRTFSAACQFVMEGDGNATGQVSPPGIQLATPESESAPGLSDMIEAGKLPPKDSKG